MYPLNTKKTNSAIFDVFNNIQNNYDGSVVHSGPTVNYECTFNPLDKVVELYERLVQAEKDKVEYLEKLLNKD